MAHHSVRPVSKRSQVSSLPRQRARQLRTTTLDQQQAPCSESKFIVLINVVISGEHWRRYLDMVRFWRCKRQALRAWLALIIDLGGRMWLRDAGCSLR